MRLRLALIGTLGIVLVLLTLSFLPLPEKAAAPEPNVYDVVMYEVKAIEYGDLIIVGREDKTNTRLVPMSTVFEYRIDVDVSDVVSLFLDSKNNILGMKEGSKWKRSEP